MRLLYARWLQARGEWHLRRLHKLNKRMHEVMNQHDDKQRGW